MTFASIHFHPEIQDISEGRYRQVRDWLSQDIYNRHQGVVSSEDGTSRSADSQRKVVLERGVYRIHSRTSWSWYKQPLGPSWGPRRSHQWLPGLSPPGTWRFKFDSSTVAFDIRCRCMFVPARNDSTNCGSMRLTGKNMSFHLVTSHCGSPPSTVTVMGIARAFAAAYTFFGRRPS